MRLTSTNTHARKMLFAAIPSICALSSKKISIYNEEMIVALCFIGFIILSRKSLGETFKMTLDGRIQAIQEESQQFPNPNEVVPLESNEQQRFLRISLRICSTVVESLPIARCAPKCEKTVQALLCRNLNVKSATLPNEKQILVIRKVEPDTFLKERMTLNGRIQAIQEGLKKTFFRFSLLVSLMILLSFLCLWGENWDFFFKISSGVGRTFIMRSLGSSLVPEVARVCLTAGLVTLSFIFFWGGLEPKVAHAAGEDSYYHSFQSRPFDLNRAPDAEPGAGLVPDLNVVSPQARRQTAIEIRGLREEIRALEGEVVDRLDRVDAGIWVGNARIRLSEQTPAFRDATAEGLLNIEADLNNAERSFQRAQEIDHERRRRVAAYQDDLLAEYRRLRYREIENADLRRQLNNRN